MLNSSFVEIRKISTINIFLEMENNGIILKRLRDVDPEIRKILIKKLKQQKYFINNFKYSEIVLIIYDCFTSKDFSVKV